MKKSDLKDGQLFVTTDFSRYGTAVMQDGAATGNFRFTTAFEDGTMSFKAATPRLDVGAVKLVYRKTKIKNAQGVETEVEFLQLMDSVNTIEEVTKKVELRAALAAVATF